MKKILVSTFLIFGVIGIVLADWPGYSERPIWLRRGESRISFSDWDFNRANLDGLKINMFRIHFMGLTMTDYDKIQTGEILKYYLDRGIYTINYTSPTDCFWDGRLRNISPIVAEWRINVLEHSPHLEKGLLCDEKGVPHVAYSNPKDRGGNAARKCGCRLSKVWNDYTHDMYDYLMNGVAAITDKPQYKSWPDYDPINKYVNGFYLDNAAPWRNCGCAECKADWKSYVKKTRSEKISDMVALSKYRGEVCYRYNKGITDLAHKNNRYTMFGGQLYFLDTEADSVLWERLCQHPPWGRLSSYYKTGLAAGRGQVSSAITYLVPPPTLDSLALPMVTPHFTQMALAEGMANMGAYILFNETSGKFAPAVKRYNEFNDLNRKIYTAAQRNGKVAIFFPLRAMYIGKENNYSLVKQQVDELAGFGIPVEVICEKDIKEDWNSQYDVIIARNLVSVNDELLDKLSNFHKNGGKLIITEDFAKFDEEGRRNTNPKAADLLKFATDRTSGIRFLALDKLEKPLGYPPDLKKHNQTYQTGYYFGVLNEVVNGKYRQRFNVSDKSDFGINSQRHPSGLESFHIVNYNYKTNPACLLKSADQSAAFDFAEDKKTNPDNKIFFYGKCIDGGADLDIYLNGKKIMSLPAKEINKIGEHEGFPVLQPRWIEINLPETEIKPLNRLEIRPQGGGNGVFALYIDPLGTAPCAYKDANSANQWSDDLSADLPKKQRGSYLISFSPEIPEKLPLCSKPAPIENGILTLSGYTGDYYALYLTPDAKSHLLKVKNDNGTLNISVPDVQIYSIIVLGKNLEELKQIAAENNDNFDF